MNIRHAKARGEWAELCLMTRATELGFVVTKPWGDLALFDLALEHHGHFARVSKYRPVRVMVYGWGDFMRIGLNRFAVRIRSTFSS